MKTVKINRRSKIGFNYSSSVVADENGRWTIPRPDSPLYIGTYKQVYDLIDGDKTLASFKSGGTYYSSQWFLKLNGKWRKIDDRRHSKWDYADLSCDYEIEVDIVDGEEQ